MRLVKKQLSRQELRLMAENGFGSLVKAVVDICQGVMVVDAQMYADLESWLIQPFTGQWSCWICHREIGRIWRA